MRAKVRREMMDAIAMNAEALETLGGGDFRKAQDMFRQNARTSPSLMTVNNLGAFYVTEGMELPNGKTRAARKLGLRLLKKAEALSQSPVNLAAIGDLAFESGDYRGAEGYYKRASALRPSAETSNNLGAALQMQGKYAEAIPVYTEAARFCAPGEKDLPNLSCAFCLLRDGDVDQARVAALSIEDTNDPDVFALACLSGETALAQAVVERMLNSFHVSLPVMAMALDCLIKSGESGVAESHALAQRERQKDFAYGAKSGIARLDKLLTSSAARETAISEYQYVPRILRTCYYVGCKKHNPI